MEEDKVLDIIWKKLKENYAVLIALVTAVITVVYAFLRLCVYIYWSGYFTRLNIDTSVMNLNFEGDIFQVIFLAIIVLVIIYMMIWVDECITKFGAELQDKKKCSQKFWVIIKMVIISFVILTMANVSAAFVLVVSLQIEFTFLILCLLIVILYVLEMLFLIVQRSYASERKERGKSLEEKIGLGCVILLIYFSFILASLYYFGSCAIEQKKQFVLVDNETYAVTYCDGSNYVVHKVDYIGEEILIYTNEQKIIRIENCEYIIKTVKSMQIID